MVQRLHSEDALGVDARKRGADGHGPGRIDELIEPLPALWFRTALHFDRPLGHVDLRDLVTDAGVDPLLAELLGRANYEVLDAFHGGSDEVRDPTGRVGGEGAPFERSDGEVVRPKASSL